MHGYIFLYTKPNIFLDKATAIANDNILARSTEHCFNKVPYYLPIRTNGFLPNLNHRGGEDRRGMYETSRFFFYLLQMYLVGSINW